MPKLTVYAGLPSAPIGSPKTWPHYWPAKSGGAAGRSGLQVAAVGVLALAAAVVLAALGRTHLRQRVAAREAEAAQQGDGKRLLDSLEAAPRSTSELSERAALCRQRRLAALLSRKSGPQSRTAVEVLPLHAMPGALTHNLVERAATGSGLSLGAAAPGGGGSGIYSSSAARHVEQQWMLDSVSLQLPPEELEVRLLLLALCCTA